MSYGAVQLTSYNFQAEGQKVVSDRSREVAGGNFYFENLEIFISLIKAPLRL